MKNHFSKVLKLLAVVALLALCSPAAKAQQYGSIATLWNAPNATNVAAGGTSNLASVVTLTKYDNFALQFDLIATNATAAAGTFDVYWDTSADGLNYSGASKPGGFVGSSGWFGVPVTNSLRTTFVTNITVNSVGYWRINWITNNSGVCFTNMLIRAYAKPKRQG